MNEQKDADAELLEYYGQYRQDKYLDKIFRQKKNGVFLDIGAHDGISISNSYFFEKYRNWTGICVETRESVFKTLTKNRSCVCENKCIGKPGKRKFLNVEGSHEMLSGLVDEFGNSYFDRIKKIVDKDHYKVIEVDCVPLNTLTKKHGFFEIDFCSIDTEGSELEVIRTIDLTDIAIKYFLVENYGKKRKLKTLMKSKGYVLIKRLVDDDLYARKRDISENFQLYLQFLYENSLGALFYALRYDLKDWLFKSFKKVLTTNG